ncbi:hypothetical protein CHS0354_032856 [Potamilus streckersoni]|uniref:Uncharacterized protein n=1 Tax=Potamilus streckersoni TaxID=2493646 RepID=A0AAE0S9T0_9BIVA|nr:hypothetical protein CHS0354_032856 [Potamilus streckersoni]
MKLSEERHRLWKAALNRKDIETEDGILEYAENADKQNDPTCNYIKVMEPESFQPTYQDEEISKAMGIQTDLTVKVMEHVSFQPTYQDEEISKAMGIQTDLTVQVMEHVSFQPAYQDEEISKAMGIQTDLTVKVIKQLENDNKSRLIKAKVNEQFDFKRLYMLLSYVDNSEQVAFYTGLPNYGVLKLVYKKKHSYIH